MSNATYAGAIIMEVDGRDIEIVSLKPTTTTGRKPVKTMNRQGRVLGYADGVTEHKIEHYRRHPDWRVVHQLGRHHQSQNHGVPHQQKRPPRVVSGLLYGGDQRAVRGGQRGAHRH